MVAKPKKPKYHKLEMGHSIHTDSGLGVMYLNDYRIHGGKPWGGFVCEKRFIISHDDLKEALSHAQVDWEKYDRR